VAPVTSTLMVEDLRSRRSQQGAYHSRPAVLAVAERPGRPLGYHCWMRYDLAILGGTIVDGTGAPRRRGDVGIAAGRIVAVGELDGPAARTIDAEGAIVTPGFVDIHTHYDGQVSWDDALAPSSLHGVTTCVMGSCGVGFAPVRRGDEARLVELMEGVEDIPGSALSEGIRWGWESVREYMDAIDASPHAIDFAVQVPHDALRMYVMGERAIAEEPATEADIAAMREATRDALLAGAVGFSTGRTDNHRTSRGKPTPASEASARELVGIAGAFAGLSHGVLQAVSDFDMMAGEDRFDAEFDVLERMVEAADGHPLSLSLMQRDQAPQQWRRILARAEQAHARGTPIRVQVAPRPIGVLLGLQATFHPFMGYPSYKEIAALPLPERVAKLRDPERRARILGEKTDKVAGDGSPIPPLADLLLAQMNMLGHRIFRLGAEPDYEPAPETSIAAQASREGGTVLETLYDALLERDGEALLYFPLYNFGAGNLDPVHEMLNHPLALPGLSDGGAHVGTICDASFPTFLLTYWGRDRARGLMPIETLVRMQTRDTASWVGMHDRGRIEVGSKADVNVIDLGALRLRPPRLVADLPAGGRRLLQSADGYRATIVSGRVIAEGGALTPERPGRLVRVGG
jgi:N-acyl-D-aspartate/D-glutamate deacylase